MAKLIAVTVGFILALHASLFCQDVEKAEEKKDPVPEASLPPDSPDEYKVCPKDVLEVTVVQEVDLSGKFEVRLEGTIKYPYIAYIPVAGLTVKEIEKVITEKLKDGYLVNPQVNVRVDFYSEKFVYVGGEVTRPGRIAFTGRNKMTLYMAIVMAGDFTSKGKKSKVILHTTDDKGKEKKLEIDVKDIINRNPELDRPLKADDKIIVPERFF